MTQAGKDRGSGMPIMPSPAQLIFCQVLNNAQFNGRFLDLFGNRPFWVFETGHYSEQIFITLSEPAQLQETIQCADHLDGQSK